MSSLRGKYEERLELIDMYKNHKCLWQYPLSKSGIDERIKTWIKIGQHFNTTAERIRGRISGLKQAFRNELKKCNKNVIIGPDGNAKIVYASQWFAFDKMSFLLQNETPSNDCDPVDGNPEESIEIKSESADDSDLEVFDDEQPIIDEIELANPSNGNNNIKHQLIPIQIPSTRIENINDETPQVSVSQVHVPQVHVPQVRIPQINVVQLNDMKNNVNSSNSLNNNNNGNNNDYGIDNFRMSLSTKTQKQQNNMVNGVISNIHKRKTIENNNCNLSIQQQNDPYNNNRNYLSNDMQIRVENEPLNDNTQNNTICSTSYCSNDLEIETVQAVNNIDIFGQYIAGKLKKYNVKTRAITENAINNILFEADMGWYENATPIPKRSKLDP